MGFQAGRTFKLTYTPHQAASVTSAPGRGTGRPSSKRTPLKPKSFSQTWPIANIPSPIPSPREWGRRHHTGLHLGWNPGFSFYIPSTTKSH